MDTEGTPFTKLRRILRTHAGTSHARHLGIQHLHQLKSDHELYNSFKTDVPLVNHNGLLSRLRQMTEQPDAPAPDLLGQPNLLCPKAAQPLVCQIGESTPGLLNAALLKQMATTEKAMLKQAGSARRGVFHLFSPSRKHQGEPPLAHLLNTSGGWFGSPPYVQDTAAIFNVAQSRYQMMHAFIDQFERVGKQVKTLIAPPETLGEIAILLAQRYSRFVPLANLLPNLRHVVFYGSQPQAMLEENKRFIQTNQTRQIILQEAYYNPYGVLAYQQDINLSRTLTLPEHPDIFYEFIPVTHLSADGRVQPGHTRYTTQTVPVGEMVELIFSTTAGVLAFASGHTFEIRGKNPLQLAYMGRTRRLSHFGENLTEAEIHTLQVAANRALAIENLAIRRLHMGDDTARKTPVWVAELNTPLGEVSQKFLQMVANQLHTELCLLNPAYHHAIQQEQAKLPEVYFLGIGTIATSFSFCGTKRFDYSPDIKLLQRLLAPKTAIKVTVNLQ